MPNDNEIKALYRKWRPAVWGEVKYQDHVVSTLRNAIAADKVGHAYIFSGPRGTGKTTAARLLAKAVNCTDGDRSKRPCGVCANCEAIAKGNFIDLIEIDAASHTGVDDARDLIEKVQYKPNIGDYKVYIIDEVHMLSKAAFNALLKTIEEPPNHVIFILATTELDKVMPTILSRCQRFEFRRFPLQDITQHLAEICQKEGISADEEALASIARNSAGGMRDAISLLDQLSGTGERITLELVQRILGTAANEAVMQTIDAVIAHDAATAITLAHEVIDRGASAQSFGKQLIEHLRNLLLVKTGNESILDVTQNVREVLVRQAGKLNLLQVIEYIKELNLANTEKQTGILPGLVIETTLAKIASTTINTNPVPPASRVAVAPPQSKVAAASAKTPVAPARQEPAQQQAQTPPAAANPKQQAPAISTAPPSAPPARPSEAALPPNTNPAQAAGSAHGTAETSYTSDQLKNAWQLVWQKIATRDKNYQALFKDSRVVDFSDNTLFLGFTSEILAKKFEEHKECSFVIEQFRAILGAPINLRAGMASKNSNNLTSTQQNGMVETALGLGGRLVK